MPPTDPLAALREGHPEPLSNVLSDYAPRLLSTIRYRQLYRLATRLLGAISYRDNALFDAARTEVTLTQQLSQRTKDFNALDEKYRDTQDRLARTQRALQAESVRVTELTNQLADVPEQDIQAGWLYARRRGGARVTVVAVIGAEEVFFTAGHSPRTYSTPLRRFHYHYERVAA